MLLHLFTYNYGHVPFLILALIILILYFRKLFSRVLPICSVVSILPRVDLAENTEMDRFCILSLFRLDTLSNIYDWTGIKEEGMQSAPRFSHFNYIHNDDVISPHRLMHCACVRVYAYVQTTPVICDDEDV